MEDLINYLNNGNINKYNLYKLLFNLKNVKLMITVINQYNINLIDYIKYLQLFFYDETDIINELISYIPINGIKEEINTNIHNNRKRKVNLFYVDIPNIDKKISFGIELESINEHYYLYNQIGKILGNWAIKEDASYNNSCEVISPILHMNKYDLKQIKYITSFMQRNDFSTNKFCGGHIHIGIDYFNDVKELKMLYYIFCNCENIFYLISNKENNLPREYIYNFANSMSDIINENKKQIISSKTIEELIKNIQVNQFTRNKDINLLNVGTKKKNTIEFRLFNSELDYNELINNIILITSLIEKSKYLAHNIDNRLLLLCSDINEDDKLRLLLDLLFKDNYTKNIFTNRYYSNKKLITDDYNPLKEMIFTKVDI